MKTGIQIIATERARQVSQEKWTSAHDDEHAAGELANAAACYAMTDTARLNPRKVTFNRLWPWLRIWWKPTPQHRIYELAKAGALIAAEIDRLQRATICTCSNGREASPFCPVHEGPRQR